VAGRVAAGSLLRQGAGPVRSPRRAQADGAPTLFAPLLEAASWLHITAPLAAGRSCPLPAAAPRLGRCLWPGWPFWLESRYWCLFTFGRPLDAADPCVRPCAAASGLPFQFARFTPPPGPDQSARARHRRRTRLLPARFFNSWRSASRLAGHNLSRAQRQRSRPRLSQPTPWRAGALSSWPTDRRQLRPAHVPILG